MLNAEVLKSSSVEKKNCWIQKCWNRVVLSLRSSGREVAPTSQLPLISGLTLGPPLSPPVPTSQGLDPFLLPALPYPASTSPLVPPCTLWVCTYPCHQFMQFYPVLYWKCTIKVCSSNNGNLLHFKCWKFFTYLWSRFLPWLLPKGKAEVFIPPQSVMMMMSQSHLIEQTVTRL